MRSRPHAWDDERRVRRWIGAVLCLAMLGISVLVVPRLGARSPIAIVTVCVLGVLIMKLVERRVRRWFDRWAEREAARTRLPGRRPERTLRTRGH